MAKIYDLKGRIKFREDFRRAEKGDELGSLLRCRQCVRRCAKCGRQGDPTNHVTHPGTGVSFRLCSVCLDEYQELVDYLETGQKKGAPSWHNREWVRHWLAWLDYQWSLSNYMSSPEVLRILEELKAGKK